MEKIASRCILFVLLYGVGTLVYVEVAVFARKQLGKGSADVKMLAVGLCRRTVSKDVGLRGVPVKIEDHFGFPRVQSFEKFEHVDEGDDLRKILLSFAEFFCIPEPVEVESGQASSVVAHDHPVDVEHREH